MKNRNWFWGIFFICAAALIILFQAGLFAEVGTFTVILTVLLVAVMAGSIMHLNFFGITFPIAFLLIIYNKSLEVGIPGSLIPWGLLSAAFFLALGLTIIFSRKGFVHWQGHNCRGNDWKSDYKSHKQGGLYSGTVDATDKDEISINVSFSASTKYINSPNLKKLNLHCSFGAIKVFFSDAQLAPEGAEVVFDCSFSGVELYVPRAWRVDNNISATLGGVDEKNKPYVVDGPVLNLVGNVSLGGVEIVYV